MESPLYGILVHAHSGLRWVLLILLIAAIVQAFSKKNGEVAFSKETGKAAFFAFMFTHIQLLLGLALYFMSPKVSFEAGVMKDAAFRLYTVEHLAMMLLGIIIITVGYIKAKKSGSFNTIFVFYSIGLLLILSRIPWPFMANGGSWF